MDDLLILILGPKKKCVEFYYFTPWTQDEIWTFRKRTEGVLDVLRPYERSIYALRKDCRVLCFVKQIKIDSLPNTNILLL